jgi:hypothetical protein
MATQQQRLNIIAVGQSTDKTGGTPNSQLYLTDDTRVIPL